MTMYRGHDMNVVYLGRTLLSRYGAALFIFGICGIVSVLTGLDHIWKIFGLEEPINLTYFAGRALHTTLIFILYGVNAGCIAFAYAYRQNYFRRGMGISNRRAKRNISPVCWDNNSFNCSECAYKYMCTKNVTMRYS